jgi:hypothetical protein
MASRYAKPFTFNTLKIATCGILAVAATIATTVTCSPAAAQLATPAVIQTGVVGGVMVDAQSVLGQSETEIDAQVLNRLQKGLKSADQDIHKTSNLRMISLKALNQKVDQALQNNQPIPVEVQFMAGLQRIKYLIVDQANSDILIGGPAEGLASDKSGNVVGAQSGRPAIHLEDFLVALRSATQARTGQGISVSLDPTPQGVQNLKKLYAAHQRFSPELVDQIQEAMGEHIVSLTGIPKDTRFAQILVAADYRMKRLAMGLAQSKAHNLPSVIEMAAKARNKMTGAPRMWMECNYQSMATDVDRSVWELRGQGVRALTENAFHNQDGVAVVAKKENKFATKWASRLTERFDEISQSETVFGDLRNLMDLSVIAAVIERESMVTKTGVDISTLLSDYVRLESRPVPQTLPTQCSFANVAAKGYIVTASGGVQVDSWTVAQNSEVVAGLHEIEKLAFASASDKWWWNAN